ncbi:Zinc finger C2H2 protein [Nosema granulosis]|uniref:Zinc finger C2H2 protein n=1 Tax=Nosema granulosis TaxID=83296 RepID=A0A9P6L0V0_9MICR|nr:Zinc finger C2H2 protein [Nosema granulosis]
MTFQLIKKLLFQYIEKNHPDIDFYGDKEFEELSAIHGREYKRYIKSRPFCLFERNIEIEREKFCREHPYNANWLKEDEEEEAKEVVEETKEEVLEIKENDSSKESSESSEAVVDLRKPRKRRIIKENMFLDTEENKKYGKIFKCELPGCNRQYTSSFGLKYHMKEGHSKEKLSIPKPFVCSVELCGRKYKNNNGLKYHLKNYHDFN